MTNRHRLTRSIRTVLCGALLLAPITAVGAQGAAAQPGVDVSRLPLDLARIQQELRQSAGEEQRDGLNLEFQIEVFGKAPDITLFGPDDNLRNGPVPYGAPTHSEIVEQITPRQYRAPVMDFSALMRWLTEKAK